MTTKTDNQNAVDMVRFGYNEDTRNLHFRVAFGGYSDGPECALEAIRAIGPYNAFEPERVIKALEPFIFMDKIGYPGIEVGREGSPVIYFSLKTDKLEDQWMLEDALKAVDADELNWGEGNDKFILRAWWD